MPRAKYGWKASKLRKRTYKKSHKKKKLALAVPNTMSYVPQYKSLLKDKQIVQFAYSEAFTLAPAASTDVYVFSANGCYDPNITGVGHQPRGFDQLMALYDHGVTIHSQIKMQAHSRSTAGTTIPIVGISLMDSNTVRTDSNDYREYGQTKSVLMGQAASNRSVVTVGYAADPNKFLGRSKPLSDPQLKYSIAANPTEQAFWHVWAQNAYGNLTNVDIIVDILYTVVLIEPVLPTQS